MLKVLDQKAPGGSRELSPATRNVNRGFNELTEVSFILPSSLCRLLIDDVPIPRSQREGLDVCKWTPGFYAGTVRAELFCDSKLNGTEYFLDVSPDPRKVGQDEFRRMLAEVWDFDPRLVVGEEAAATKIGASGDSADSMVRYMRISRFGADLAAAAAAIRRRPHRNLRSSRRLVPIQSVRKADLHTVTAAIRSGASGLLANLSESDEIESSTLARQPLFDVPISEETFDTAANRTMAALLDHVRRSIGEVDRAMELAMRRELEVAQSHDLMDRWPRRHEILMRIDDSIRNVLANAPFASCRNRHISAAGLTAIAAHPVYARTQQLIWRVLRFGYQGSLIDEWSAMSPTYGVYESWCFASVARWVRTLHPTWEWHLSSPSKGAYNLVGRNGTRSVQLYLQRTFSYVSAPGDAAMWSISAEMIPDICLIVTDGDRRDWIVMDAKYRHGRQNVLDGMRRSAHVYRDALRLGDSPPAFSLLLIPSESEDARWIMNPEYRAKHRVGAVVLSPDRQDLGFLAQFIDGFFKSSSPSRETRGEAK